MKSPSPKKQIQECHCQYCRVITESAEDLEAHLNESMPCHTSYLMRFKVKNLDPILVSKFGCLFCKARPGIKLSIHFRKNCDCKHKYFQRYNVSSVEDVLSLLENLKRKLRPSRSRAKRNLENQKRKEVKMNDGSRLKSSSELLNEFRRDTEFANVKLCCKCQQNICHGETVSPAELKKEKEDESEETLKMLRRFQTFFKCRKCIGGEKVDEAAKISMGKISEGSRTIFIPSEYLGDDVLDDDWRGRESSTSFTCLIPASSEVLDIIENSQVKSRSCDTGVMMKTDPVLEDVISISYENELHKFKKAKYFSDRYQGTLKEGSVNTLSSLDKVSSEHKLVGSDSWHRIEEETSHHRLDQNGAICFKIEVSLPIQEEVLSSCLIQSGKVVSVEYRGNSLSELERNYFVHNHDHKTDCNDSCVKEEMQFYLQGAPQLHESKFVGTRLVSIQQKVQSFLKHYLKESSSDLYSEAHSLTLMYDPDGNVTLEGMFWPREFNEINLLFSKQPTQPVDEDLLFKARQYIDSILSSSSDSSIIAAQFSLSELESKKVSNLIKQFQYDDSSEPQLPALMTDLTRCPENDFISNITSSLKFRTIVFNKLRSLGKDQLRIYTSVSWLKSVFSTFCCDIIEENGKRSWRVDGDGVSLYFLIDKRLLALTGNFPDDPLLALYHYCLTCTSLTESFQVVIKTVQLYDVFTKPYHINLIKAFKSTMVVKPMNGHLIKPPITYDKNQSINGVSDTVQNFHREVSLCEAFSLLDRTMQRTFNNTSSEYICAYKERKMYFKKASSTTETTFTIEGKRGIFEKQSTNIDKYFSRKGSDHVTLFEFVSWYDYVGVEESRQLMKIFSKDGAPSINDSEVISAMDAKKMLPDLILTSNNDAMKIRSEAKIVRYPKFDDEAKHRYSKVLMFFPSHTEITKDQDVSDAFFTREDNENDRTLIERIER